MSTYRRHLNKTEPLKRSHVEQYQKVEYYPINNSNAKKHISNQLDQVRSEILSNC
jgi:hypothetical protein